MSLKAYKKGELKEMLQKLNLASDGLKNELEDRLQNYLDANSKTIEEVPELADHFVDLPVSPSTLRKAARKTIAVVTGEDSDGELKTTEMLQPVTRKLQDITQDMEISPSKVAQWAADTKKKVFNSKNIPKTVTNAIPTAGTMRSQLSQVTTVTGIAIATEAIILSRALVPISYEIKFGGFGAVTLPDLYVALFGDNFWRSTSTWLVLQIIPLIISTLVNPRAESVSKKYRAAHALAYSFDPVVFGIAKLVLVYMAFETSAFSSFASKQVSMLQYTVGKDTFMISAAVTLLFALYDAIL